jgi:CPA1 family monovalent cation:H+ antiporter
MTGTVLVVGLAIAVVVVASRILSRRRSGIPHPVFLVVAGAAAGLVPGSPAVHLNPRLVFLGFLPPLVFHAGVVTSPPELRVNATAIGLSALGVVHR